MAPTAGTTSPQGSRERRLPASALTASAPGTTGQGSAEGVEAQHGELPVLILIHGADQARSAVHLAHHAACHKRHSIGTGWPVIGWLVRRTMEGVPRQIKLAMAAAAAVTFASRAPPPAGPTLQWWQIEVLGYDQAFFGVLAQIGTGLAIAGCLLLRARIVRVPLATALAWLAILGAVLSLPTIRMLFELHN